MDKTTTTVYVNPAATKLTKNEMDELLKLIYPVNSIYITANQSSTCPMQTVMEGTQWVLVAQDLTLQGAKKTTDAGSTVKAGLPNITGTIGAMDLTDTKTGAFTAKEAIYWNGYGGPGTYLYQIRQFNANNGVKNSAKDIYRDDCSTVQPPAYLVNVWKRTL